MVKRYTIYRGNRRLSGFYPNGLKDVFAFRRNDWFSFETKEEAENFITRIKQSIEEEKERYGEKYYKLYSSIARNLKIYMEEF